MRELEQQLASEKALGERTKAELASEKALNERNKAELAEKARELTGFINLRTELNAPQRNSAGPLFTVTTPTTPNRVEANDKLIRELFAMGFKADTIMRALNAMKSAGLSAATSEEVAGYIVDNLRD